MSFQMFFDCAPHSCSPLFILAMTDKSSRPETSGGTELQSSFRNKLVFAVECSRTLLPIYGIYQRFSAPGLQPDAGPWPEPDQATETDLPPMHSAPHNCFARTHVCLCQHERSPSPSCTRSPCFAHAHESAHAGCPAFLRGSAGPRSQKG